MNLVVGFATLLVLSVHSVAGFCDGSKADSLIKELDSFNSLLENYISVADSNPTSAKGNAHQLLKKLGKRTATAPHGVPVAHEVKSIHVNPHDKPAASVHTVAAAKAPVAEVANVNQHGAIQASKKLEVTAKPALKRETKTHSVSSEAREAFSTYIPVEEQRHDTLLKQSFDALAHQQTVLDSMKGVCIPETHKPKVIAGFTKMFSLYLTHANSLKDVGNLERRARDQAGWLTMGNDVNSGYNGDDAELASTSTSSSSTLQGYPYGYGYPEYPPPQPQYITVTVSPSTVAAAPAPSSTGDDGDSDSDSSGDDDGGDDSSSSNTPAPSPLPTAKHHGIVYRSTIGLLMGSIHLVESIFGLGGKSIVSDVAPLNELIKKVSTQYNAKLWIQ